MRKLKVLQKIGFGLLLFYVFLLSIKLMGTSFKLLGADFAKSLVGLTTNPLSGLFIGILATSLVQSSSATTSVVVGMVASTVLPISNAIPLIMGANIGTSITNTIVSLGHITKKKEFIRAFEVATIHDFFNLLVVSIFFPIEILFHPLERIATFFASRVNDVGISATFSSPLGLVVKPGVKFIQSLVANQPLVLLAIGVLFLFGSLYFFTNLVRPLVKTEFKEHLNKYFFSSPLRTLLLGIGLTIFAQSSSITTSLIVPVAGVGFFTLHRIFPYILGANIGTTFTAMLAALSVGSLPATIVAFVHLLFNVFGSILVYPLRSIPLHFSQQMAVSVSHSKYRPIAYIGLIFFVLPAVFVYFLI